MGDDEDDDHEEANGAATSEDEEEVEHGNGDDEEADDDEEGGHGEQHVEYEDMNTPLTSAMLDPHVQELLLKNTSTNARASDRRKSKLAQLKNSVVRRKSWAGGVPLESSFRSSGDEGKTWMDRHKHGRSPPILEEALS
jgi:ABC-type Zn2+ transport system substrate-binding protein/surface adhesin